MNVMKSFCCVLSSQPIYLRSHLLNVLTFFSPDWGMLRVSRSVQIFFKQQSNTIYSSIYAELAAWR